MHYKRNLFGRAAGALLAVSLLAGCSNAGQAGSSSSQAQSGSAVQAGAPVRYQVDPATFSLDIFAGETALPVSLPGEKRQVENLKESEAETAWEYPQDNISVSVKQENGYLQVTVTSLAKEDNTFAWPFVSGEQYYLPLGEGKRVPQGDAAWGSYLAGKEFSAMEQLSMPFWATAYGEHAVLVVLENPFRTNLVFAEQGKTEFRVEHRYPEIDPEKTNRFRIYLTDNDPVAAAKLYRAYVQEQGRFVTLEEKAKQTPGIEKLFGAPQIYLWGDNLLTPQDVNWPAFREALSSEPVRHALSMNSEPEVAQVFEQISKQDYADAYQKNVVCRVLSEALKREDFYNAQVLPEQDADMKALLTRGVESLTPVERLRLNKHALAANLPGVFQPVESWMNSDTVDLLADMKEAGIDKAWIGLNSWEQAYAKPELVEQAEKQGYLIASYDSYHSIHEPGNEQWITAKFEDAALYEDATVLLQNGEKASGFQNVGRKLNPALSMPAVKQRLSGIMEAGLPFNSWFIDCDATGEIFDDYTPAHPTTQQQDIAARLERMAYARDEYGFVIGSEGGNDFAASTIAFAHGIELPTFAWQDADMKANKESPYYIGAYFSPSGGVAAHFANQIPVKDVFYPIFLDQRYDVPLYKLVYNESVITSYHWDWSTFKIEGAVQNRMLREVLYNTPPLYHLDRAEWEKYGQAIAEHNAVWARFHEEAVRQEMTSFASLTEDCSVQRTQYGQGLSVTANFGDTAFAFEQQEIPPHSLLLEQNGTTTVYTPNGAAAG